jgi:2-polyprenyl-3-methyl-5-hydroxy-6-metoxy-1,4-benzoquinol methylase
MPVIDRDKWLVDLVKNKSILHVGCTDHPITAEKIANGRILHGQLLKSASHVVGLDYDSEGVSRLRELFPSYEFIMHNAEELENCSVLQNRTFQMVVAADVVEHLSNFGKFLQGVKSLLTPDGKLVLTTPSAFSIKRMVPMALMGVERVHPDHTAYYSLATLKHLLSRYGFEIEAGAMFQWKNPTWKNRLVNALFSPFVAISGGRLSDEIAIIARSIEA